MREILIFMEFFSIWIAPVIGGPAVNNLLEKDLFVAKASCDTLSLVIRVGQCYWIVLPGAAQ